MNRGNIVIENVSKLSTFIEMSKANEYLQIYAEKIMNNKSKSMKYIADFNFTALDLLYTSLQIMHNRDKLSSKEINKLDKKELTFYFDKRKCIPSFKEQVPTLKSEAQVIDYLIKALGSGSYACSSNNKVKFNNGLVIESDWLTSFTAFLVSSLNCNQDLSLDRKTYSFKTVEIPEIEEGDKKYFFKNIKLYEYNVAKKNNQDLSSQDVKYLIDVLSPIENYDFKQLQEINSALAKEKFSLSINKGTAIFTKEQKVTIEKLLMEDHHNKKMVNEYIKDCLQCYNTESRNNKKELIGTFELLKSLAHAYKGNYSIEECRKLFSLDKNKITNAFAIASFYINYIYDEESLEKYFNYELLHIEEIKPTIIDYETIEYKNILNTLSILNKKVINENRTINRLLINGRKIVKKNKALIRENSAKLMNSCQALEQLVKEVKMKQRDLDNIKEVNRNKANMNKTKINHIKEAIMSGRYSFDEKNKMLIFDNYSEKDFHQTFHLELTLDSFLSHILADYNRNLRINFYQL